MRRCSGISFGPTDEVETGKLAVGKAFGNGLHAFGKNFSIVQHQMLDPRRGHQRLIQETKGSRLKRARFQADRFCPRAVDDLMIHYVACAPKPRSES